MDTGDNRMAVARGLLEGLRDLFCEIDLDAVGSGDYCTEVNVIVSGS